MKQLCRFALGLAFALAIPATGASAAKIELLNVSYDPTRELYQQINSAFQRHWLAASKQPIDIKQSHGGSGKQARAVIDGLQADVVTLALAYDVDEIAKRGLISSPAWQKRLPNNSTPYFSTIVLLVRHGNPKHIRDWDDLVRPGVTVITPNPKTSGGARWNYLAAWGYAQRKYGVNKAKLFMAKLFRNVPVLDSGARGATTTFVERGQGDVLIAWENEALLTVRKLAPGQFDIVAPSVSILAEPPVALVDKVVDKKGTRTAAEAYLKFLYTPEAQEIIARNYFRARNPAVAARYNSQFPKLTLFTIDRNFGGWGRAQQLHFSDGGLFDQEYEAAKR